MTIHHSKKYDASAPQVCFWAKVFEAFNELGSCITGRATRRGKFLTWLVHIAEAKVDHFKIELLVE